MMLDTYQQILWIPSRCTRSYRGRAFWWWESMLCCRRCTSTLHTTDTHSCDSTGRRTNCICNTYSRYPLINNNKYMSEW